MAYSMFYSTNLKADEVDFKHALLKGLAPDRGLYFLKDIPKLSKDEISSMKGKSYAEIAYKVIKSIISGEVDDASLKALAKDAYNFDVPLEKINGTDYLLRLDRGPTASFKDFAARMMARLMQYFMKKENKNIIILTATSGDTGSAVAQAFFGLDNIKVVVLFPKDEVSDRQRKQMTTLGKNVTAIAVKGKFDDCQALVKQAFSDDELSYLNLSSANSISVGRLIPQAVYYFYAYSRLDSDEVVFCVPSGNFGNLMGGLIAKRMGLPVKRFISAVNENDEFPAFLKSGRYSKIAPSRNCLSNAMNVGHPSNLARLVALYGGQMDEKGVISKAPDIAAIRKDIFSISVTDQETKDAIKEAYDNYEVIIEPHGAVGWHALQKYRKETGDKTPAISLETADPAKFPDEIIRITGKEPNIPESLKAIEGKKELMKNINADYGELKSLLKSRF